MSRKWVYLFTEGNANMRELLGGKGANLAEMTNIGLPVPQGFTITTEAYRRGVFYWIWCKYIARYKIRKTLYCRK